MTARRRPGPERPEPAPGTWVPKFVVEIWISPEMRARHPERPLTLCEAAELGRQPQPDPQPEPDPDPEPEIEP